MRRGWVERSSTVLGIGYIPVASGTFASAAGVVLYLLIRNNIFLYLAVTLLVTAIGFAVSGRAASSFKKADPHEVVIDELSGMLITYLFVPFSVFNIIAGFFLFRFFDIAKPYPIRRLEKIKGAQGIMLDDIAAALTANIVLQIIALIVIPAKAGI